MTLISVTQSAMEISGKPVGGSWPKQFQKQHPDLKMKTIIPSEQVHVKALNKPTVDKFFDMLASVIEEYDITLGNVYNMDEKGI